MTVKMDLQDLIIRDLEESDFNSWSVLWDKNNLGHENLAVTQTTWKRLLDKNSSVNGLVAEANGQLAGLIHYILHPTTGHIEPVCYMQDVYVDEPYRQNGIARKMVEQLVNIARKEQWARLYWLAENNNIAAQKLYKNIGVKLDFSLHVLPITM
jgi:ribosomal protein S18 acetylase RimI-like enzyme